MTQYSQPPVLARRLFDHIAGRRPIRQALIMILLVALTPLVFFAFVQAAIRVDAGRDRLFTNLQGIATRAADTETAILEQLQYSVALVANNPDLVANGGRNCAKALSDAALHMPDISALRSVDAADNVLCRFDSTTMATSNNSITMQAMWRHGGQTGRVLATIDLEQYQTRLARRYLSSPAAVAIVSPAGDMLARSRALPQIRLPARPSDVIGSVNDKTGGAWLVGAVPLIPVNSREAALLLVVTMPDPGWWGSDQWIVITSFLLPLLAIMLSSLALWWAVSQVVLRWIETLRDAANQIADRSYGMGPGQFDDAPDEFRDLAAAMQQMARTIERRDEALIVNLEKQRALSLELNHRVRNNLQVIGSYLALDGGDNHADRLKDTKLRVAALALVQRLLYDKGEIGLVPAEPLLRTLTSQVSRHFDLVVSNALSTQEEELAFDLDTASTLALYLVEAFSALQGADQAMITVSNENDWVETSISWSDGPTADAINTSPLIKGFAAQLAGRMETRGARAMTLVFPRVRTFKPVVRQALN